MASWRTDALLSKLQLVLRAVIERLQPSHKLGCQVQSLTTLAEFCDVGGLV